MGRRAEKIELSEAERVVLGGLIRAASTPQRLASRARMILLLDKGLGISETALRLGVWRKTVSQWRARWLAEAGSAAPALERLGDAPRCGAPPRIAAEACCAIIALACEPPADCGLPLSHWSASDLAREAMSRRLVEQISPRTAGRFLKRCRSKAPSGAPLADARAGP